MRLCPLGYKFLSVMLLAGLLCGCAWGETDAGKAPDYSQKASWCKIPATITKDVDTFYINSTAYIMGSFEDGASDYATLDNAERLKGFEEALNKFL